jgi:type IV secretion system protein VirD4
MKREIVTVYLVLPADRLESHANYLRLIVTSALRTLLRSPPSETLPPVLFILDEFAALGYLPPIENAAGIARGFGVQLWPILQDLNQLKALYRDRWQTFIGNAGLLTAFAPRDWFTAKYLSDLCGQKLRNVRSRSMSDEGRVNWNDAPHEFPRFRPEDLMRMPQGQMLCLAAGVPLPFFTQVPGYWKTPQGRDLDPNPYFKRKYQRRAS